jgi:hypothetical protein
MNHLVKEVNRDRRGFRDFQHYWVKEATQR